LLLYIKEAALLKSIAGIAIFTALAIILSLFGACLPTLGSAASEPRLVISSLGAEYPVLYPRQHTEIECVVSGVEASKLEYEWVCSSGSLSGEGSIVTWTAPAEYGDYHIMVVVKDSKGNNTEGSLTVSVVVKPPEACCHGKGR
jgi:hypothetical protein